MDVQSDTTVQVRHNKQCTVKHIHVVVWIIIHLNDMLRKFLVCTNDRSRLHELCHAYNTLFHCCSTLKEDVTTREELKREYKFTSRNIER